MKIGIFGLPGSGKSWFRRWLVAQLREAGIKAEHWDADRFKKARCPEDEDMKKPIAADTQTVWLIEDVRGTAPHKPILQPGEKEGAWKPISFYDFILYLLPDWPTYAAFWVARALQWQKHAIGNWTRETGWEDLPTEDVIARRVHHFLEGYEQWIRADAAVLRMAAPLVPHLIVEPVWQPDQIEWRGFNLAAWLNHLRPDISQ